MFSRNLADFVWSTDDFIVNKFLRNINTCCYVIAVPVTNFQEVLFLLIDGYVTYFRQDSKTHAQSFLLRFANRHKSFARFK